jgi:hypothetical protein
VGRGDRVPLLVTLVLQGINGPLLAHKLYLQKTASYTDPLSGFLSVVTYTADPYISVVTYTADPYISAVRYTADRYISVVTYTADPYIGAVTYTADRYAHLIATCAKFALRPTFRHVNVVEFAEYLWA